METTPTKQRGTFEEVSEENKGDNTPRTPSLKARVLNLGTTLNNANLLVQKYEKEISHLKREKENITSEYLKLQIIHHEHEETHKSQNDALIKANSNLQDQLDSSLKKPVILNDENLRRIKEMRSSCVAMKSELEELGSSYNTMKNEFIDMFTKFSNGFETLQATQTKQIHTLQEENMAYKSRLSLEKGMRKKIHNELIEERGNIRVHCRIRPTKDDPCIVEVEDEVIALKNTKKFAFDKVYSTLSTQDDVYKDVAPLVTSFVDGYNVLIMAYGQTSSGKTHTMQGVDTTPGLIPKAIDQIFDQANEISHVKLSMIEIYNEKLVDLLSKDPSSQFPEVFHSGKEVVIKNLTIFKESDVNVIKQTIIKGFDNRTTGSTKMNLYSSRSHCILTIELERKGIKNLLHFVDLAGSENSEMSGVSGNGQLEASFVNKSLGCLQDVILALRQKKQHVPYRNSKLTRILQDSFNNSKMLMLIHVSDSKKLMSETSHSLEFGAKSRCIITNRK